MPELPELVNMHNPLHIMVAELTEYGPFRDNPSRSINPTLHCNGAGRERAVANARLDSHSSPVGLNDGFRHAHAQGFLNADDVKQNLMKFKAVKEPAYSTSTGKLYQT
jgi:hypothetical protein